MCRMCRKIFTGVMKIVSEDGGVHVHIHAYIHTYIHTHIHMCRMCRKIFTGVMKIVSEDGDTVKVEVVHYAAAAGMCACECMHV
jgi:hypothetical protein